MQYNISCVEQLDRASLELNYDFPIYNRFALILIDNIVENMCHKRCETIISLSKTWSASEKNEVSRQNQARILGKFFDQKLKFLLQRKEISDNEYAFIDISHTYRNLAYHLGNTHERLAFPMAWEYLELACDLFSRLDTMFTCYSSTDKETPAFSKHLRNAGIENILIENDIRIKLANSILQQRPSLPEPLSSVLSNDINEIIDDIESSMDFIETNDPDKLNHDDALTKIQYWKDLFDDIPIRIDEGTREYNEFIKSKRMEMKYSWQPKFSSIPINSWRRRGNNIKSSEKWGAIQSYSNLKKEIDYLYSAIKECARQLDGYLQQQYDIYRGK